MRNIITKQFHTQRGVKIRVTLDNTVENEFFNSYYLFQQGLPQAGGPISYLSRLQSEIYGPQLRGMLIYREKSQTANIALRLMPSITNAI